jgi:hypothetical protein
MVIHILHNITLTNTNTHIHKLTHTHTHTHTHTAIYNYTNYSNRKKIPKISYHTISSKLSKSEN